MGAFLSISVAYVVTFVVMFALHGVFHGFLGKKVIDETIVPLKGLPIAKISMKMATLARLIEMTALAILLSLFPHELLTVTRGAIVGGVLAAAMIFSWHTVNKMYWPSWKLNLIEFDGGWHVGVGIICGALFALIRHLV